MAKINLVCEKCGGNIILRGSSGIGTCESCFSQFVIKEDTIIQHITQNITKQVYGYESKDVEELLVDADKLENVGDTKKANLKYKKAIDLEPDCWKAWLGYAGTGGDRNGYISMVPAYRKAYALATEELQQAKTFVDMTGYLPDRNIRSAFVRAFNETDDKDGLFYKVLGVIGRDESEIARLAVDTCPDDWRTHFAFAKFRQIRARWAELEGGFFSKKYLPAHAQEVANYFIKTYTLAKKDSDDAAKTVLKYIENMKSDKSYAVFANELLRQIQSKG